MEHKKIDLGNIHKPHNWEFADATARAAAVIADSDLIGALALQLDDGTYWRLTSVGPTVWTKAATPNATDAELRDRSTHTGSQAISTVTGLQTALDAAASHASSTSNPHAVTKAQVGLGNVENKSSADIRSEISSGNVTTALGYTPLAPSVVGDTVASLVAGKVPSSQLPAYVDDVLEYANLAGFPGTGTAGIIYVALDTNKTYRWSGSAYTEISPSPGSTDSVTEGSSNLYFTAARVRDAVLTGLTTVSSAVIAATDSVIGALQKLQAQITAHTTNTSNPHSVTKTQVGLGSVDNTSDADKPISTATQTALNAKFDKSGGTITGDVGVAGSVTVSDPDGRTATLEPPQASNSNVATLRATTNHPIRIKSGGTGGSASPILFNTNNTDVASFDASGKLGVGLSSPAYNVDVFGTTPAIRVWANGVGTGVKLEQSSATGNATLNVMDGYAFHVATNNVVRTTTTSDGNFLVGATTSDGFGSAHRIKKDGAAQGDFVLSVDGGVDYSAAFQAVNGGGFNSTNAAVRLGNNTVTGRSINAGGTINSLGADYAEYRKNNGLTIAKGQIVGYQRDGTLTLTWSEATMARVKSTDPCMVGGDAWGTEEKVGVRPVEPKFTPPQYTGRVKPDDLAPEPQAPAQFTRSAPVNPGDDAGAVAAAVYALALRDYTAAQQAHADSVSAHSRALTAWRAASAQHARAMTAWTADQTAHTAAVREARRVFDETAMPAYRAALAAFESRLEAARQQVDRIAYCGIVPCNVTGATPGHYIVAAEGPNDTIVGVSVQRPTEEQWPWVVGRCISVLPDGRAEIDVMLS